MSKRPTLEGLIAQSATLLRVDALSVDGAAGKRSRALVLTFDVGPLIVEPSHDGSELRFAALESGEVLDQGSVSLNEEEPWWALLGHPLTRAEEILEPDGHRAGLELQFRRDDENPRRVALRLRDDAVEVAPEPRERTLH